MPTPSDEIRWAITDALVAGAPKCGDCRHWMKTLDCPREPGWGKGGPTAGTVACDQFEGRRARTEEGNSHD